MPPAREPDRPSPRAAAQVENARARRQQLRESTPVKLLLDGALIGIVQPVPLAFAARIVVAANGVRSITVRTHSRCYPEDRTSVSGRSVEAARGSQKVKVLPTPSWDPTEMSPPCRRANSRLKWRPNPVPLMWLFSAATT